MENLDNVENLEYLANELKEEEKNESKETDDESYETEEAEASRPSPKDIVITECTRIINQYAALIPDDEAFQKGFKEKDINGCINHIMNNLTSKRIYGGADSLLYEYIHEYYVDKIEANDNWSQYLTPNPAPRKEAPKVELTEEQKKVAEERALQNYEAECKAKLIEAERKKAEKEKAKLEKQKEKEAERKAEEAKRREEEKNAGAFEQLSLFD